MPNAEAICGDLTSESTTVTAYPESASANAICAVNIGRLSVATSALTDNTAGLGMFAIMAILARWYEE
ncbi:hypothetical protein GCM10027344_14020 [Spelaeicoccus albus]